MKKVEAYWRKDVYRFPYTRYRAHCSNCGYLATMKYGDRDNLYYEPKMCPNCKATMCAPKPQFVLSSHPWVIAWAQKGVRR